MHKLASEQDFLNLIDSHFPREHRAMLLGRGDDCTILPCPDRICLSSDLFLEDVHFRRKYFTPDDIGYKSLAVNVSDIAAMGARPLGFSLSLMIPPGLEPNFFPSFFQGMSRLCTQLDLPLTGGDLSRSTSLGVGITIWGSREDGKYLTRAGARPDDLVFTVGPVGLARVGFLVLEHGGQAEHYPAAVEHFKRPAIPLSQALQLGDSGLVRSCMDVSDGLAADLPRLLGPHGLEITLQESDLHPELLAFARTRSLPAMETALLGGEDFALLGTVAEHHTSKLRGTVPGLSLLGRVTAGPGLRWQGDRLDLGGFDHFTGGA